MDPSALIFVALAVAWAVYLVPKALKHHDEAVRSRSVDKFSHTMRVLARREPVDRRNARLVVAPVRAVVRPPVETKRRTTSGPAADAPVPRRPQVTRESARRAARRRRNVLASILVVNLVVAGLAAGSVLSWAWTALPAVLLVAWLVACRVSVKAERSARTAAPRDAIEIGLPPEVDSEETQADLPPVPAAPTPARRPAIPAQPNPEAPVPAAEVPLVLSGEIPIVTASVTGGWDMVPTTLPTYVTKPAAQRRSVQTIDLESTGVWSSGRSESDSALAREAAATQKAAAADAELADEKRASGS
ncbi:hypothetical protein EXE58_11480 [Nocardioides seonyuensis]|uniref:Uncharacterized protein n=1 Tax=Nocardioides seonyuensis TaxID=2518371 RepID=A0A4P7IJF6_9ACTN|nr:hypothetical protein [Nocardioides seonyuensis]QBX56021.1 hypothetical protein EXE58_11480 [Nocardioides seonyuensis]